MSTEQNPDILLPSASYGPGENYRNHIVDYNRSVQGLHVSLIREILPEHFTTEYPNLVTFIEGYYDYHSADENISIIKDLYSIRDIERAEATQLDLIFAEIAAGASRGYFSDPREVLRNFANFYRVKGTKYSAEGFFRAFFNTDVQIEYPKDNIFIVSESEIGVESLKFIINNELYQIFSVLIKSGIPINQWRELYKKFVHPAGWFLGGAVQIEEEGILWGVNVNPFENIFMPQNIPGEAPPLAVEGVATLFPNNVQIPTFGEMTGILEDGLDSGDAPEYISLTATISKWQNFTIQQLEDVYGDISSVMHVNSPTFDDDSDPTFYPYTIRFDNEAETMDQNQYYIISRDSINDDYMFTGYVDSGYVLLSP